MKRLIPCPQWTNGQGVQLSAPDFIGGKVASHSVWENTIWPDPPSSVSLPRKRKVSATFVVSEIHEDEIFTFCLYGYPGTCLEINYDEPYVNCVSIFIHFRILVNDIVIHDGPLFLRNHGHCGYGQKTYLTFTAKDKLLRRGINHLTLENLSAEASFPGMDAYHLISFLLRPSDGELIGEWPRKCFSVKVADDFF